MRKCPNKKQGSSNEGNKSQSSSIAPPDRVAPRGATSSAGGGTNRLYSLNNRQEHENSPDIITDMIQVFDFSVYALRPRSNFIFYNSICCHELLCYF